MVDLPLAAPIPFKEALDQAHDVPLNIGFKASDG